MIFQYEFYGKNVGLGLVLILLISLSACEEQDHTFSNAHEKKSSTITQNEVVNLNRLQQGQLNEDSTQIQVEEISENSSQEELINDEIDVKSAALNEELTPLNIDLEWSNKQTNSEQDDFLHTLPVDTLTTKWMNERVADLNESVQAKIAILQRVEIENNSAAKSVALTALNVEEVDVASLALDMIYSWGDRSLAQGLIKVSSNHPDAGIRQQAQELYEYFNEEF